MKIPKKKNVLPYFEIILWPININVQNNTFLSNQIKKCSFSSAEGVRAPSPITYRAYSTNYTKNDKNDRVEL